MDRPHAEQEPGWRAAARHLLTSSAPSHFPAHRFCRHADSWAGGNHHVHRAPSRQAPTVRQGAVRHAVRGRVRAGRTQADASIATKVSRRCVRVRPGEAHGRGLMRHGLPCETPPTPQQLLYTAGSRTLRLSKKL